MATYDEASRERVVGEDPAQKRSDRDDFARDRARVLHSAALRRLAAKTQVLGPDTDDFIRNRLTHSLEVAQIGREFGSALGCNADVVDAACLAHDLGHPPFGHNGEAALNEAMAAIGGFEGNAQTFRILTRLEPKRQAADGTSVGLNLTRGSLDAATKYPWLRGQSTVVPHKFGCYPEDQRIFEWVRASAPAQTPMRRCIEAQVMDWSDDVAYSVHDVEDGITLGLIDVRAFGDDAEVAAVAHTARAAFGETFDHGQLVASFAQLRADGVLPQHFSADRDGSAALKDMTSRLIGRFVGAVEDATRAVVGPGALARYSADLVIPETVIHECVMLKALSAHFVRNTEARIALLREQRATIAALVAAFQDKPERLDPLMAEAFSASDTDDARNRVIADQVASLTDARAQRLALQWS